MNVYQAIAIVSAALALAAGGWDALRLRRTQRYSGLGLSIGAIGPILSLVLYLLVTNLALKQLVSIGLVAGGAAVGVWTARRAALSRTDVTGEIRLVGASWLPVPAAGCVAALQVCSAIDSFAGMIISLAALEASVGFGVAAAVTLLYRRSTMDVARPVATGAPPYPPAPAAPAQ
jgi:hypothetical protein